MREIFLILLFLSTSSFIPSSRPHPQLSSSPPALEFVIFIFLLFVSLLLIHKLWFLCFCFFFLQSFTQYQTYYLQLSCKTAVLFVFHGKLLLTLCCVPWRFISCLIHFLFQTVMVRFEMSQQVGLGSSFRCNADSSAPKRTFV